jgi:hypothetical protein
MLKRYIVERSSRGIGFSTSEDFAEMAKKSNDIIQQLGPGIQWEESFVTNDKLVCLYLAEDEELIWRHARMLNMPVDSVMEVKKNIDPTAATLADGPYLPREEDIYDSIL